MAILSLFIAPQRKSSHLSHLKIQLILLPFTKNMDILAKF